MILGDITAKNGMIVINGMPGISLRMECANKPHQSLLQRFFGSCEEEDAHEEVQKSYFCWTCGAAYGVPEAREFLAHIRECCKEDASTQEI